MFKNYFSVAVRSLKKNKIFSFINVFGLATGLCCTMLITAFLYEELSYDRFPRQSSQIYRVELQITQNGGVVKYPDVDVAVGGGIKNSYPEVHASTRIAGSGEMFVRYADKLFKEKTITYCDSNFLRFFSIPLVEGDDQTALNSPFCIVITRALAGKYFGNEAPVGKTLLIGGNVFKVTGIIDKIPDKAHFHFDGFISMASNKYAMNGHTWSNIGFYTYLQLNINSDPRKLEAKFPALISKYVAPEAAHDMGISLEEAQKVANTWKFYLMPLTDIHLFSHTKYELEPNGDIQYVYIFGALALFILLLACVNFTNLSTASSSKRSREMGIRKVLGTVRKQLVFQFLLESVLLTFCAMFFAFVLVYFLLPSYNQLSGKHISILFFLDYRSALVTLGLVLFVGLLAGIYPAFFLSSFETIAVLKSKIPVTTGKRFSLRSGLVVFQFMISTALIIATIIVFQQLHYMQNKKLGYDKAQVLVIQDTYGLDSNQYAFKQKLLKDSRVVNATISRDAPVGRSEGEMDGSQVYAKENSAHETESEIHANFFHVDYDYIPTLGIQMAAGRNFANSFGADSNAVVINEAAVRDLGWRDNEAALHKTIVSSGRHEYEVIGVVRDFNYTSAKQRIVPVLMMLRHNNGSLMVKISTSDVRGFLADTKAEWNSFNARTPFTYYFLDDKFSSLYAGEEKTGQIFSLFAGIAVLIASLGLFGLVAFTTEQRTREIGIRKVLGASVKQVFVLLSREFLGLVCIAFLISIPLTWLAMHNWLNDFAYRISISWKVFIAGGILALLIALVTVSFQAIKAAVANPVNSIRAEG
jgi:putative ABC transport system permease protein